MEADTKKLVFGERRTGVRNDPAFLLAILYTVGFFAFVVALFLIPIPVSNKELASQMLPVLSMIQGGIVQYFYTKGQQQSRDKTDATIQKMAEVAKTANDNTALVATLPAATASSVPIKTDTLNVDASTVNVEGKDKTSV